MLLFRYLVEKYSAGKATCFHGRLGIEKNLLCFITCYCIKWDPGEFDAVGKSKDECRNVSADFAAVAVFKCFVLLTAPLSCQEKNKSCVYHGARQLYPLSMVFLHMSSTELCSSCSETHAANNKITMSGFKIPNSWSRVYCICQCISRPLNYCKENFCCCFQTECNIC